MHIAGILLTGFLGLHPSAARSFVAPARCEATARCTCAPVTDIRAHRDQMSDVFVGIPIARRDTMVGRTGYSGAVLQPERAQIVTLQVRQRWKGAIRDTIEVYTGQAGGSCGISFRMGERYLVFARSSGRTLSTGLCDQTNLEALSSRNLRALGRPMRPRRR